MADFNTNAQRAIDLTRLASRIYYKSIILAQENTVTIEQATSEYMAADTGFLVRSIEILGPVCKVLKGRFNILKLFSLASVLTGINFDDPYKNERDVLKAFCRKWLPASKLNLTPYEIELIT